MHICFQRETATYGENAMFSLLSRLFSQPKDSDDDDAEEDVSYFDWSQNARIVMAIVVVFLSAMVVWWLMS